MTTSTKYKTYSKYKPSGIDPAGKPSASNEASWLGDIPEGWEAKRLRYLASLQKGKKPEENTESVDGLPYLTMDFLRGQEEPTKFMPVSESVVVKDGDILLLWDGANAGEFVNGVEGILSSTMAKVSFDKHKVNSRYCSYFLESFEKKLRELTIGMGIPHVSGDIVKDCITPIPSGLEQKSIANFLDRETAKIDDVMAKKQKMMELLKEKRQALITHAVTKGLNPKAKMKASGIEWLGDIPEEWEVKKLKYVAKSNVSTLVESTDKEYSFKYLDIGNVGTGYVIEEPAEVDFENAPSRARRVVKKNDTIISTVRTYLKAIYHFEDEQVNMIVSTGFVVIEVGEKINPNFFYYLSLSENFIDSIVSNSYGVSYPAINESFLMTLPVWYPEIDEQKKIVSFLDREIAKIDEMMKKVEMQIEKLQEYRQALITSAVTGKIKV